MFRNIKIKGFERYRVSKNGKILSPKGRVLKPYVDTRNENRRPSVTLKTLENKSSSFSVQTLIDSAFSIEEQKEELLLMRLNEFTYDYVFNKIEDLRLEKKITWKELSKITNSTALKSKIINKNLRVIDLIEIVKHFDLPISYFFGGDKMLELVNSNLKVQISNLNLENQALSKEIELLNKEIVDKSKIITLYEKLNK